MVHADTPNFGAFIFRNCVKFWVRAHTTALHLWGLNLTWTWIHPCQILPLTLKSLNKSLKCRPMRFEQLPVKHRAFSFPLGPLRKRAKSEPHQNWHSDRSGLHHSCTFNTISHPSYSFAALGALKIWSKCISISKFPQPHNPLSESAQILRDDPYWSSPHTQKI